jgi:rubrerythrin
VRPEEEQMNKEQQKTLTGLQTAMQMEIEGKAFYQQLSQTGANEAGRKLFGALAAEEDIHLKKFEQIYRAIEAKESWPEIKVGASQAGTSTGIFKQKPTGNMGSTASELKSIQKAMQMENKTRDYYLAQAAGAVYPLEKQYYEAVAGQERTHHALLLDYFEFLKDPAQWFTMKEHQSLDGG